METELPGFYELQAVGEVLMHRMQRTEQAVLKLKNFATLVEQMLFFALAERLLLPSTGRRYASCLYSLMFYNVLAYCFGYVRCLFTEQQRWYVTVADNSPIKHLALSTTKFVLEWSKAVSFLVTVAFSVIFFALMDSTMHHYKPTALHSFVTLAYYMATEKTFVELFPEVLRYLDLESLESLEHVYGPVLLRLFTISLSGCFVLLLLASAPWRFLAIVAYLNVYLRAKELQQTHWLELRRERDLLLRFRSASPEEIRRFDDVCAVCLGPMRLARVTPCQHLFHPSCLRMCLKNLQDCPLCKQPFVFL
ncbi:RING finger protein 145 [Trichogramma pretiosum]|uniref:RING finger protein 145 n=1 Tax=Trichogramma pretiosum TaxID=7493 RepID=UPI0006C97A2A|nr:RING finger protein 145 [Trichogramma pretiosum]